LIYIASSSSFRSDIYLVALGDGEPSLDDLTIEKMLSCELDNTNRLSVGVILVPHVKHQAVGLMANMNLKGFVEI
jgi:hypothetical protein